MFSFGQTSSKALSTCHKDLRVIHRAAIKDIRIDYGIHEGGRSFEQQLEYYQKGASTLDPRIPEKLKAAKHVITDFRPLSEATDIHIASKYKDKPLTWQKDSLIYVCAYLVATADRLCDENAIGHKLRWGYNWDMDEIIGLDQDFDDLPHLELVKP